MVPRVTDRCLYGLAEVFAGLAFAVELPVVASKSSSFRPFEKAPSLASFHIILHAQTCSRTCQTLQVTSYWLLVDLQVGFVRLSDAAEAFLTCGNECRLRAIPT